MQNTMYLITDLNFSVVQSFVTYVYWKKVKVISLTTFVEKVLQIF